MLAVHGDLAVHSDLAMSSDLTSHQDFPHASWTGEHPCSVQYRYRCTGLRSGDPPGEIVIPHIHAVIRRACLRACHIGLQGTPNRIGEAEVEVFGELDARQQLAVLVFC